MSPPKSADLPSIQWVPGFFPGGKSVRADVDNPPAASTEVKNGRSRCTSNPLCYRGML